MSSPLQPGANEPKDEPGIDREELLGILEEAIRDIHGHARNREGDRNPEVEQMQIK